MERAAGERSLFQFHKGTIKTKMQDFATAENWNFNSIKVRLKRSFVGTSKTCMQYFNSIKVRLKHPLGTRTASRSKISIP